MTKKTTKSKSDETSAKLMQQIADLTTALQRERADAINMRRQHEEQLANLRTVIKSNVIRELLPIIDNFERAQRHVPAELADNDYVKGVETIVNQFSKTLADIGVERIPTTGHSFDPRYHEAVSMDEGDGAREIVGEELQPGYILRKDGSEEVLRHAMVRVKMAD